MARWELMKAAWKGREPVSTSEIVSGIRAGTIKALQPAVRAGEQFRVARPEIAERISRTPAASQIRASVQLRRDIDTAKRQVISSEKSIVLLKTKIDKASVQNGVFTGTDKQFLQHEKDVKAYNTNIGRINASNERIAALEGEKFIPKIERAVSSHIPTLADISRKGAQFRVKYPEASAKIYSTFQAAHVKTERIGTQSQREALAGYTYGSYSSLQKQPVKTAASFAIGGASVKAMRMVGLVGKAYGAGKWSKRMGKAAQYGIILYYGKKSAEYIMSAPNARVAGERAAKIMYTEVLPMAAGIKAVGVTPKVIKKIKTTTKRIALDESARLDYGKIGLKEKYELPKAKIRTDKTYEQFIKEQKISKDVLSKTEYNNLRASVSQSVKASRAKAIKYKARKEKIVKKVKTETTVHKKQLKQKDKAKNAEFKARSKVTKLEPIENILSKFARKQARLDKKFENGQIEWNTYIKQSKNIEKQVSDTMTFYEDAIIIVEKLKISPPKAKPRAEPASKIQVKVTQKRKQIIKTSTKAKVTVKTATKTAQKVKTEVRTATRAKVKTKAQQKTKLATLIALRRATQTNTQLLTKTLAQLKAATKEVQKIKPAVAMVAATTTKARTLTDLATLKRIVRESIAEQKAAARKLTAAIRLIEAIKFKVPPFIPKKKITTKKKLTKRQREVMVLKQKNLNVVATFRDLFGGL